MYNVGDTIRIVRMVENILHEQERFKPGKIYTINNVIPNGRLSGEVEYEVFDGTKNTHLYHSEVELVKKNNVYRVGGNV